LALRGRDYGDRVEVEQKFRKLIRMLRFDAEWFECGPRKVGFIESDDDACAAADCRGKYMPVVRVRKGHALDGSSCSGMVAGPMLSFLALMAVVWTVRLQYDLLRGDHEKQTADQHIRWLDGIYRDILDLLNAPLRSDGGAESTTTWAVLHQEVDRSTPNQGILKARLEELLRLITQYCQAVALYRESVTEFFDARIFQDRGARILDNIKPFLSLPGPNAAVPIEFCDMHLRGETKRQAAEALGRKTRI
jgi:hypothetical protein